MNVLGLFSIPNWLLFILFIIATFYIYSSWNYGYWEKQNVKTMKPTPFLGSMAKMIATTAAELDLENYKKFGKVFGFYEFRRPYLMIHDLEMIKTILIRDFKYFVDRRKVPSGGKAKLLTRQFLTNLEGDEWRSARAVLTPTFTTGKLKHMGNLMDDCARKMVESCRQDIKKHDGVVNLKDRIGVYTMDVISNCCFGSTLNSQDPNDPFIEHAKLLFNRDFNLVLLFIFVFPKLIEVFELSMFPLKCLTYFEDAVHKVVNFRRNQNERRDDFLQLLLDAQSQENKGKLLEDDDDDTFSAEEKVKVNSSTWKKTKVLDESGLVANAILFLLAGFDTTANTICFALYLLALNPDIQAKLQEEIDEAVKTHGKLNHEIVMALPYVDMVLSETLRMYPPALRLERRCASDYDLDGILIKKGMIVAAGIYGIHHDPEIYPDPFKFDPERFTPENKAQRHPMAYLPFGAGPRICIGMRFAQMEAKIALVNFFKDFKVSPCAQTEIPIKFRKAIPMMSPVNGITLKVEARS